MFSIILFGVFFGFIIFLFTLIACKKNGKFYFAPLVTFLSAFLITVYGLFEIGGFEGMAYGFLGAGILSVAIVGTLSLPLFAKKLNNKQLNKVDKSILVSLPLVLFTAIGLILYTNEDYWVNDKGVIKEENQTSDSFYTVTTISEGAKQLHIQLGKKYAGKEIEVKKVKTIGNTEVTLKIVDGRNRNTTPYITIGLDAIVEPLKVQTTEGDIISSNRGNDK